MSNFSIAKAALFLATLIVVCIGSFVTASTAPESGWVIDAYPRTIVSTFEIRLYNANTATQGFPTLDVVDLRGQTIERLADRIRLVPGLQTIEVDASQWSTGMHLILVSDNESRSGTIKLLRAGN